MSDHILPSRVPARERSVPAPSSATPVRRGAGVAALNDLLDGGFEANAAWCITGAPGAGKTLLGLHFLAAGLAQGESGLYITAAETPARVVQFFARCWPELEAGVAQHRLAVLDPSPFFTELRLAQERRARQRVNTWDEVWRFVQDVTRQARNQGARRVVIDPITPLLLAHESALDLWDMVQMLAGTLGESLGATTLLTHVALPLSPYVAVEHTLGALCLGTLHLEQHAGGHITIQARKRRYAPFGAGSVTLAIDHAGHLKAAEGPRMPLMERAA